MRTVTKDDLLWGGKWVLAFAIGQWARLPASVVLLLVMMSMDMVTGLLRGVATSTVSSAICAKGLAKKALALCLLLTMELAGRQLDLPIGIGASLAWGYIFREFISIVENVGQSGVWIPPQATSFLKRFEKLQSEEEPRRQ